MSAQFDSLRMQFGHDVLGPILTEFCLRLWLYDRFTPAPDQHVILFCARGGLRLQMLFECFVDKVGLATRIQRKSLMISRLVAARTGLVNPGPGMLAELSREFASCSMREVGFALSQERNDFPDSWDQPFEASRFLVLLQESNFEVDHFKAHVANQDRLFRLHLASLLEGRRNAVVCDTGLYGSTLRLLQEGIPEINWSCLQFARSNYKGLSAPHFGSIHGLSVESEGYEPWSPNTSALRFWQLIESVLEPPLPSVRTFRFPPGEDVPKSNLEIHGWQDQVGTREQDHFAGIVAYVQSLTPSRVSAIPAAAALAWRSLQRAIARPTAADVHRLSIGERSRDFGRFDKVAPLRTAAGGGASLATIRSSLWREGAVRQAFPKAGGPLLAGLEALHTIRAVRRAGLRATRQIRRIASNMTALKA